MKVGNMTICIGDSHIVTPRDDVPDGDCFWLYYVSMTMFVIPALIEIVLWVVLRQVTIASRNYGIVERTLSTTSSYLHPYVSISPRKASTVARKDVTGKSSTPFRNTWLKTNKGILHKLSQN